MNVRCIFEAGILRRFVAIPVVAGMLCTALLAEEISKDDLAIELYPTYSFELNGKRMARIRARVYQAKENSLLRRAALETIRQDYGSGFSADDQNRMMERIKPFFHDNERGRRLQLSLAGMTMSLSETGSDGIVEAMVAIPRDASGVDVTASIENSRCSSVVQHVARGGVSVISDIDDTIRISMVLDKKELIRRTFALPYVSVPGMSDAYRLMANRGAVFHYVSGSPWQLYRPIHDFIAEQGFPLGSMHLKQLRFLDSSFIKFLRADQLAYKTEVIERIIADFPERKFILIGDSGEKDPEVYAAITARHPTRVLAVLIRDLGNAPRARYDKLFGALPVRFHLVPDAVSVKDIVASLPIQ